MIVSLETGRLRCSLCAREWTPEIDGVVPQRCNVCFGCRDCEMKMATVRGHSCSGRIETRPQRALRNLEGLPTDLIDAIRRNVPRG